MKKRKSGRGIADRDGLLAELGLLAWGSHGRFVRLLIANDGMPKPGPTAWAIDPEIERLFGKIRDAVDSYYVRLEVQMRRHAEDKKHAELVKELAAIYKDKMLLADSKRQRSAIEEAIKRCGLPIQPKKLTRLTKHARSVTDDDGPLEAARRAVSLYMASSTRLKASAPEVTRKPAARVERRVKTEWPEPTSIDAARVAVGAGRVFFGLCQHEARLVSASRGVLSKIAHGDGDCPERLAKTILARRNERRQDGEPITGGEA